LAADLASDNAATNKADHTSDGIRALICGHSMSRTKLLLAVALTSSIVSGVAVSADTGRIKRNLPDLAEAERLASEIAMNDSSLQRGDIVVTDRGFFVFRGLAPDGYTYEFSPIPNPISGGRTVR
jgi:hypothetical protein